MKAVLPLSPGVFDPALDRLAARLPYLLPFRCRVCGRVSSARSDRQAFVNPREALNCLRCGATTRQRQLAATAARHLAGPEPSLPRSLRAAANHAGVAIYNAEARGPVHESLLGLDGYTASEFFDSSLPGGAEVDGVRHEDLRALSFGDSEFGLVLTSDVLEHVPDPYAAHREIYRVLTPGGAHVFTVPFYADRFRDEVRARQRSDGSVDHVLEAQFHGDPLRPQDGSLVFTIFAVEMLVRLEELGYAVQVHRIQSVRLGSYGTNGLVFIAERPHTI